MNPLRIELKELLEENKILKEAKSSTGNEDIDQLISTNVDNINKIIKKLIDKDTFERNTTKNPYIKKEENKKQTRKKQET